MFGWQPPHDLGTHSPHALHARVPRRTARPASGFGSRGPARQAEEGRPGVQGAVAVPAGKVALVHGQRPEGLLPRLLLRQARRHHLVLDGDRGRRLRGSRRAAGVDGRHGAAGRRRPTPRGTSSAARRCTTSWSSRPNSSPTRWRRATARRRAAISATARITPQTQLQFRIGYAPPDRFALEGASRRAGHLHRRHGRGGACSSPATRSRCPTIASATA